jgi:hypothetical protein
MNSKRPVLVEIAQGFILIQALFWLAFGIMVLLGIHPGMPESAMIRWIMAVLSFTGAFTLGILMILLARRNHPAYYLITGLTALLCILTFTDQFGLPDLIYLIITAGTLILLLINRRWYLGEDRPPHE